MIVKKFNKFSFYDFNSIKYIVKKITIARKQIENKRKDIRKNR